MEQIVTRILEAEKEAESVLQQARVKAAELRSQADAESERQLQGARQEAQERLREALKRVRAELEGNRAQALQRIEQDNERFLGERREAIQRTADKVLSLLLEPQLSVAEPPDETPVAEG